jgi:succinate dehydrogenase / fumarate reductase membrane anchor subunit
MSLRSPMGRVLGLGTAKGGSHHWWMQRVTSLALLILTLWFVASLLTFSTFEYTLMTGWIGKPFNAVMLSLLIATATYHSQLGVQVVVEDYVVAKFLKILVMILLSFTHAALAALGIFAVLRIAFGAAA